MYNNHRFQLIHPYNGSKIYVTNSVDKAASKCYQELKNNPNKYFNFFTVYNLDTFETFNYKINKNQIAGMKLDDKPGNSSCADPMKLQQEAGFINNENSQNSIINNNYEKLLPTSNEVCLKCNHKGCKGQLCANMCNEKNNNHNLDIEKMLDSKLEPIKNSIKDIQNILLNLH
jgi:hypothetical protein